MRAAALALLVVTCQPGQAPRRLPPPAIIPNGTVQLDQCAVYVGAYVRQPDQSVMCASRGEPLPEA